MVRRSLRIGLEVIGTLVAGLVIVAGFAAYRFSEGRPFHLQFLIPYIERGLTPPSGDVHIKLDDLVIAWTGGQRLIGLRATHVRAVTKDGRVLASVPQLGIDISLRGLLRGLVAPTTIDFYNPQIHMRRNKDGRFQFLTAAARKGQPNQFIPEFLQNLTGPPNLDTAVGYLRRAHFIDGTVDLEDQRTGLTWHVPKIDIELLRDSQGIIGKMSLQIAELGNPAVVDTDFVFDAASAEISLEGKFSGLDIASFGLFEPDLAGLASSHFQFNGTIGTMINIDGTTGPVHFSLGGGPGTIDLPQHFQAPLPITSLALVGQLDSGRDSVRVDELTLDLGGPLISAQARLTGLTSYHIGKTGRLRVAGSARVANIPVGRLPDLWPRGQKGKDGARDWVVQNIDQGLVEKVEVKFDVAFPGGDLDAAQVLAFGGTMKANGLGLHYFRPMPPIRGAKGTASFDATKFTADFTGATVGKITAKTGHLTITGLDKPDQIVAVEGDIEGPLKDALELLDHAPLGYPSKMGLNPASASGKVSTHLQLQLPARNHLRAGELRIDAHARIEQGSLAKIFLGRDATDANIELKIDTEGMLALGNGRFGGIPATVRWDSRFAPSEAEYSDRITMAADTSTDALAGLGFDYRQIVNGPLHVDLVYTNPRSGPKDIAADFDLTRASAAIDVFKWSKPPDAPARASIRLTLQGDRPLAITDFRFEASDLSGDGDGRFDPRGKLVYIGFRHMTLGRTRLDNVALDFSGERIDARIGGGEFDAEPFIGKSTLASHSAAEDGKPTRPFTIVTDHLTRVIIGPDREIDDIHFSFDYDGLHWQKLQAAGTPRGGKPMTISWLPAADGKHRLSVVAEDAGTALKILGVIDSVVGGKLTITGTAPDNDPKRPIKGRAEVTEYRLVNQSALVRLLTIATFTGVLDAMTGQGFQMYRFEADFTKAGGRIDVPLARTWGPSLGLTATGFFDYGTDQIDLKGTVVPAYALNSVLGQIPIVGFLLTGGKGSGVFAAVYTATGKLSQPTISVNPLSALAPGFLRGVFGLFSSGDQGPAALPPNFGQTGSGK
ncbi:MAG TPA: DUF3971 domain-containing protein [Dongiaceae bacterium]|nr:DUF3971 domain-containing protein [Dongiaceae bacterium]